MSSWSVEFSPVENHLAGVAGSHYVKTFLELRPLEMVGNHRRDVKVRFQHDRHLVPGLVHLASVNALDGEHVENYAMPVDCHFGGGDPEHGDLGAVTHVREHFRKCLG